MSIIQIPLTQNKIVIIDKQDYDLVKTYTWCAAYRPPMWYAVSNKWKNKKNYTILMHRLILNAPPDKVVDHISCNGLNNCRNNIRICTQSQNLQHARPQIGTSKYKGVCYWKSRNGWRSRINIDGKEKHLGTFKEEKIAALVYNIAALKYFGEFAYQNIID